MHEPKHSASLLRQLVPHTEAEQTWPEGQVHPPPPAAHVTTPASLAGPVEHVGSTPQYVLLFVGLMQLSKQLMNPVWHESTQPPSSHTCPEAHAVGLVQLGMPAPQYWLLVFGSMHVLLQSA